MSVEDPTGPAGGDVGSPGASSLDGNPKPWWPNGSWPADRRQWVLRDQVARGSRSRR